MTGPLLALWSPPRCRSTAFFRSMLQRDDFLTVHEPFSVLHEQGSVDIRGTIVGSEAAVLGRLRELAKAAPVFFKDTMDCRFPEVLADWRFLGLDAVHTFLIRAPAESVPSYYALNRAVTLEQVGFEALYELFTAVRSATGVTPVVIDAADLVRRPADMVRAYCAAVGISFRPEALRWPAGKRLEWQVTDRWHATVAASTGFVDTGPGRGVPPDQAPHLRGYIEHHLPFYRALAEHRLRPAADGSRTEHAIHHEER
jgi:hypothetical protein